MSDITDKAFQVKTRLFNLVLQTKTNIMCTLSYDIMCYLTKLTQHKITYNTHDSVSMPNRVFTITAKYNVIKLYTSTIQFYHQRLTSTVCQVGRLVFVKMFISKLVIL